MIDDLALIKIGESDGYPIFDVNGVSVTCAADFSTLTEDEVGRIMLATGSLGITDPANSECTPIVFTNPSKEIVEKAIANIPASRINNLNVATLEELDVLPIFEKKYGGATVKKAIQIISQNGLDFSEAQAKQVIGCFAEFNNGKFTEPAAEQLAICVEFGFIITEL